MALCRKGEEARAVCSRSVRDRSLERFQRGGVRAPCLARNVPRVRRGDFFPFRNESRRAPVAFGAESVTRRRRGIFFPFRKEYESLRRAAIGPVNLW